MPRYLHKLPIRRYGILLLALLVMLGCLIAYKEIEARQQRDTLSSFQNKALVVSTSRAELQAWSPQVDAVGTFRAVNGVDLSFETAGIVEDISFNSGQDVSTGEVLVRLKDDDERAKMRSLEALAALARTTYRRNVELARMQAVSQATLDSNAANLKNAEAQLSQQSAIVDKRTIRAPFSGRLGLRAVDLGQYVSAGTAIVTLQSLDPVLVDFSLPQQELKVVRVGQQVSVIVDTFRDRTFSGVITAINPKVDQASRNVAVQATIGNPEGKLYPGMFSTVKVMAGAPAEAVTVPQSAIVYSPYGDSVYIAEHDEKRGLFARFAFVTLGEARGNLVAISSGVKEGDAIVTAGQIKLRNGAPIKIDDVNGARADPITRIR